MELDDYIGITAIIGEEGTCKTSMGLSFPKKLVHMDIDVGGYHRAAWRISTEGITSKSYPMPIQMDKLLGQQASKSGSTISVRFPRKVEGMKEQWQAIIIDFVAACMNPEVKSIVIDSATLFWNIDHKSVLQEAQERQLYRWQTDPATTRAAFDENNFRERLQPIEYGPANDKMRMVFHTARTYRKNLILTHYPTDAYGSVPDSKGNMVEGKTGEKVMDGFKETGKLVDLVVWTSVKEYMADGKKTKMPVAKITKCGIEGMGLDAVGLEIPANFEAIINLRNAMRGAKI